MSKSVALVAAVSVDFPKNKCNFLHKNKLDTYRYRRFARFTHCRLQNHDINDIYK